jgi:hypothetical protein
MPEDYRKLDQLSARLRMNETSSNGSGSGDRVVVAIAARRRDDSRSSNQLIARRLLAG